MDIDKKEKILIFRIFLYFFIFFYLHIPGFAQKNPEIVSSIEIRGNKIISKDKIVTQIKTRIGQVYNENVVNQDIKRIYSLGYFEDISTEVEQEDNKVKLIFIVKEKPILKEIKIEGAKKIRPSHLIKEIDLKKGSFLDETKIKEAKQRILDLYVKKGFPKTEVEYKISKDSLKNEAELVFKIKESKRLRIKRIFVMGNVTFSDKRILKLMKTRPAWLLRAGFFKEKVFEDDLERIKDFYKREGFQDIKVTPKIETDTQRGLLYITLNIEEGKRYLIGDIKLEGAEEIPLEEVEKALTISTADIYSEEKIQEQVSKIQEVYFNRGYIFSQVKPVSFLNPKTGLVDVTFKIVENSLIYVRMIEIQGNTKTKDKVIRRELRIKPGEIFDGKKLKRSKQNLENLGFFEEIKFDVRSAPQPNYQDLVVEVKEAKTGSFSFGGGYSSVDQFIGFVELKQRNFDLFNFPYFTGAGQDLTLYLQTGTTTEEYLLSFTEPWFLDRPVSLGIDAFRREHERESDVGYGYNEKRKGGRLRLGKRFNDYFRISGSYSFETITISDVSPDATSELLKEEGENDISKIGFSLTWDYRDNVFSPSRGFIFSNSLEVAGGPFSGDKDFFKFYSSFSKYFPLFRGSVLEFRLRAGIAKEYGDSNEVPIYERFFAGGASTIRGYQERKVGPIDPVSEDPIGGEALFVGNLEYTYPLGDYFKIACFFDTGRVWKDYSDFLSGDLMSSVGIGLRVKTPLGPLSVDYGYPLDLEPGEEKKAGRFHFNISRGF